MADKIVQNKTLSRNKMIFPKALKGVNEYIVVQAQREIHIQTCFALIAFKNITVKGEGDLITTFSSIHSFLTHCANVSKLLWSSENGRRPTITIKTELGKNLADIINAPDLPLLKDKTFRNDLDHYDERLVEWIKTEYPKHEVGDPSRRSISDLTTKDYMGDSKTLSLRNYSPKTKIYSYGDRDLNLEKLRDELIKLQEFIGGPDCPKRSDEA